MKIYRSREVGQSYITSVWTTLIAMVHALWLMIKIRPEVVLCLSLLGSFINLHVNLLQFEWFCVATIQILCNGPGTCIPLCAIAFIFKVHIPSFFCYHFHNFIYPIQFGNLWCEVCLSFFCIGTGNQMVINFLRREYCKSQKALLEWLAPIQVADGWSTLCSMATAATTISPSYLCWSTHVINWFLHVSELFVVLFHFQFYSSAFCHLQTQQFKIL